MNQIVPFTYEDNSIRVVEKDGDPWFVAKDVCDFFGVTNRNRVMQNIADEDKGGTRLSTPGGDQTLTTINESGLYSLLFALNPNNARGLSEEERNAKYERVHNFKRWVTHEVLPAIRRHGMYATPDTIEKMLADPDTMITVLEALKAERAKRAELESENAAQKQALAEVQPKVSYYDLVITSHDAVPVTNIAKEYGMSARKLNAKLHELGVQYRVGGKRNWVLTAKYQGHGYTDTKTHVIDQGNHTVIHTYWTQKGRLFLYDLLKQHGILPEIERGEAA